VAGNPHAFFPLSGNATDDPRLQDIAEALLKRRTFLTPFAQGL
jgi:hypothetical protein